MSTSIDAPPVAPGPPDGPEDGADWVQREMQRRMAERGAGRGGRHARREVVEPPRGVDHVPRHAVDTPGPGALRPAPVGGPRRPAGPPAATDVAGWSRPDTDGVPSPAPPADDRPADDRPADDRAPAAAPPASGPATPSPATPAPAATPAVVRPVASTPDPPGGVLGGPSRSGRPAPRAFRRRTIDVRSILDDGPAEFGGPRFHEPDTYEPPQLKEPDTFGGPRFHEPAPRTPVGPDGLVDAAALGLDVPRRTTAPGPAADVRPPRAPARLLAAPPGVETTTRIGPVRADDLDDDDDPDDDDLDDMADDDGVLWTRDAPGPPTLVPSAQRTTVVLAERRARARPVRNVETLQDGSVVGELLRTDLIRSQLGLALRSALAAGLFLGLLPLAFALFPVLGRVEVLGFRLPWILLGFAVYPFLWLLGRLHTRSAERIEREFADQVQD